MGDQDCLQGSRGSHAQILADVCDFDSALALLAQQEQICADLQDPAALQICLGIQAGGLAQMGKLLEALELHRREEAICRRHGLICPLVQSLGSQSALLEAMGHPAEAFAPFVEKGNLLRSMDDPELLALVLVKQAVLIMEGLGNAVEEEAVMKEALAVAEQASLAEMAAQVADSLEQVRRQTRKGRNRGH